MNDIWFYYLLSTLQNGSLLQFDLCFDFVLSSQFSPNSILLKYFFNLKTIMMRTTKISDLFKSLKKEKSTFLVKISVHAQIFSVEKMIIYNLAIFIWHLLFSIRNKVMGKTMFSLQKTRFREIFFSHKKDVHIKNYFSHLIIS